MAGLTSSRESSACWWYLAPLAVDDGEAFRSDGRGDDEYSEVGAVECEAYESLLLRLRES